MKALPAVLCAMLVSVALAGETTRPQPPKFAKKPAVSKDGDKSKIEFELDREADVAVFVENAAGKVVRHLVAGVLGKNAPKPLKSNSLAQSVTWDGKDDAGKKAVGGPFKVRVAAGLGVKFAGTAFGSEDKADDLTNVVGLAAAPNGKVYVLSNRWKRAWWTHTAIHVYKRDGSYEKTIKPFPANIKPEKVKKLTPFTMPDGRVMPVVYRVLAMSYYPNEDLPQQMTVDGEGNIHFLVTRAAYRKNSPKFMATIDADGGVPLETYAGPMLPSETSAGNPHLCAASDGKSVFATGVQRGNAAKGSKYRPNRPCVRRIALPDRKDAGVVFGDPKVAGSDNTHLKDPKGLAVDGKGRLLIADRGNNRVVVLDEKTAKVLSSFEVKAPGWIGAHRKTGAVYVATGGSVVKYELDEKLKATEKGRVKLQAVAERYRSRVRWSFALDDSEENAVLWVGLSGGGIPLARCEETGGKFTDLEKAKYRPARSYWNLFPSLGRDKVGCKVGHYTVRVLDEKTGKTRDIRLTGSSGQTYRMGPNDEFYGMDHWKWGIRRWDKNGKFLPYEDSKDDKAFKGRLWNNPTGTTSWERDFDVDRHGNVYVKQRGKVYHGRMMVDMYDRSGKKLGRKIWVVSDGSHGPRVDAAGNIYIAESIKPHGKPFPDFFKGKLPASKIDKKGDVAGQYRWMYGSILKFGPEGGAVWFPKKGDRDKYGYDGEAKLAPGLKKVKASYAGGDRNTMVDAEIQGAKWVHYGASYLLDMHPGHNRRCHCTATEFEVDDFGRSYYTDQGRFRVVIIDTNGNEILAFGQYGNQDSTGELAFSWFTGLGFSEDYVYVSDGSNRRVIRAKMTYAADEKVEVK